MSKKLLIGIVILICSIAAFLLSNILWIAPEDSLQPSIELIPFFIIYSTIDSIAFGIGMAFLIFGFPSRKNSSLSVFTYLSVAWLLVSWWPHDNFHRTLEHNNFVGLLYLEYGFHFTLIIASTIVLMFFLKNKELY